MAFNHKNEDNALSEINVTPLVDVMLVLLIIFIVTAPLLTQSIHVHLPETVKNPPANDSQSHLLNVELNIQGELSLTYHQQTQMVSLNNPSQITAIFKQLFAQDKDLILAFSADSQAKHGEVMQIIARAQAVGITKLSFLTVEESTRLK
ncbi:MAG: hypothetical protein RL637_1821 [Pseudomonadota bacterium]|jgi:biopolymer transport protein ExbD